MVILENTFLKSQIYDKLVTMWPLSLPHNEKTFSNFVDVSLSVQLKYMFPKNL